MAKIECLRDVGAFWKLVYGSNFPSFFLKQIITENKAIFLNINVVLKHLTTNLTPNFFYVICFMAFYCRWEFIYLFSCSFLINLLFDCRNRRLYNWKKRNDYRKCVDSFDLIKKLKLHCFLITSVLFFLFNSWTIIESLTNYKNTWENRAKNRGFLIAYEKQLDNGRGVWVVVIIKHIRGLNSIQIKTNTLLLIRHSSYFHH